MLLIFGSTALLLFFALFPTLPASNRPLCVYSNQLRDDLKWVLVRALGKAQKTIHLQIYSLTDPDIKELLKRKSSEGVAIEIFYDKKASPDLNRDLAPWGIFCFPMQATGLMHRKIFVIDGRQVYLSSANLTTASLKMHDNVMLGIWNEELAHFCTRSSEAKGTFQIGGAELTLLLLPQAREEALDLLLCKIHSSEKSIRAALFTLTHPKIIDGLIHAKERQVEVKIAIDYYSRRGASKKAVHSLESGGVSVLESLGQQLLHHKWALIDETTLIFGSTNWTQAAFRENQDYLVFLAGLDREQKRSFKNIWQAIARESL